MSFQRKKHPILIKYDIFEEFRQVNQSKFFQNFATVVNFWRVNQKSIQGPFIFFIHCGCSLQAKKYIYKSTTNQ